MSDTNTTPAVTAESVDQSSLSTIKRFGWAIFIAVAVAISETLTKLTPQLADFIAALLPAWAVWIAPYVKMALLAFAAWLGKLGKDLHVESVEGAKSLPTPASDSPKKYY